MFLEKKPYTGSGKGMFLIISAPSGAGKTTLSTLLLQKDVNLRRSVSITTRKPRFGEVDGKDYQFVSKDLFLNKCQNGLMLEHASVFGNLYGTSCEEVDKILNDGYDVLCVIDWQGALQVFEKIDCVSIFVLPPSLDDLMSRLVQRNQDDEQTIKCRIEQSQEEIIQCHNYDYVIVNDDLDRCLEDVLAILTAERLRSANRKHIIDSLIKP